MSFCAQYSLGPGLGKHGKNEKLLMMLTKASEKQPTWSNLRYFPLDVITNTTLHMTTKPDELDISISETMTVIADTTFIVL